jgi:acetyl esterase
MNDEGVIDPWVADWLEANPERATPMEELDPELLPLARGPVGFPVTREIDHVDDDEVDGIPIRIYRNDGPSNGLLVYFHGGAFCIGSIGLMDNVARELAHCADVVVVSVEYRLAPEDPYPAGLDDCEKVTRWAYANAERLGASPSAVAVGGESAGGNLAAAVALRLREERDISLAAQVLIYPGTGGSAVTPSMKEFDGLILSLKGMELFWGLYTAGRDLDHDPFATPLSAPDVAGLPPAMVLLGGCDLLRDEGRAYAAHLRDRGVDVEEICYPGQPHGFVNFGFPTAATLFDDIGRWLPQRLAEPITATGDRGSPQR